MAYGYYADEVVVKKVRGINPDVRVLIESVQRTVRRISYVSLGCHVPGATMPTPDRKDPLSLLLGACKRLIVHIPEPDLALDVAMCKFVDRFFEFYFVPISPHEKRDPYEWLYSRPYPERRRRQIAENYERGEPDNTEDSDAHIKLETYSGYKMPRFIRPTSDWGLMRMGPTQALVEQQVFALPCFIKKVPAHMRVAWLSAQLESVSSDMTENDFESMEVHLQGPRAMWQHRLSTRFYCRLYDCNELLRIRYETAIPGLGKTGRPPVTICGPIKLEGAYGLNSGKLETSEVNADQNVVTYAFIQEHYFGHRFEDMAKYARVEMLDLVEHARVKHDVRVRMINRAVEQGLVLKTTAEFNTQVPSVGPSGNFEGDDSLNSPDLGESPTAAQYRSIGYCCEPRVSRYVTGTDFCGMVFDQTEGVMVTDIREVLVAFGWGSQDYLDAGLGSVRVQELVRAKGYSTVHQYLNCPVLHELGLWALRVTRGIDMRRFFSRNLKMSNWDRQQLYEAWLALRDMDIPQPVEKPRARLLIERLYGVTVAQQLHMEEWFRHSNKIEPFVCVDVSSFPNDWLHYDSFYTRVCEKEHARKPVMFDYPTHDCFPDGWWTAHGDQIRDLRGRKGLDVFR